MLTLMVGLYPLNFSERTKSLSPAFYYFGLALLATLFCNHLYILAQHNVDVPIYEQWHFLTEGIAKPFNIDWYAQQFGRHRMFWTKVQNQLLFFFGNWNIEVLRISNFLLFGAGLVALLRLFTAADSAVRVWMPYFLIFLLTSLQHRAFYFSSAAHVHWIVLAGAGSIFFIFHPRQRPIQLAIGCLCTGVMLFANAGGVAALLSIIVVYGLRQWLTGTKLEGKRRAFFNFIAVTSVLLALLLVWFQDYLYFLGHTLFYPNDVRFWNYFLNLIALGFGITKISYQSGILFALLVFVPWILIAIRRRGDFTPHQWRVVGLLGVTAAILSTLAMGIASFGLATSKSSRYSTYALLLVPICVSGWFQLLGKNTKTQWATMAFLWVFLSYGFWPHWNYSVYQRHEMRMNRGIECLREYVNAETTEPMFCPDLFPKKLDARFIQRARRWNLSFMRTLNTRHVL